MRYFELVEYNIKNIPYEKLQKLLNHPRFKNWFNNSKVVDKKGMPLVCHHTTVHDFKLFEPFSHFGTEMAALDLFKTKFMNTDSNWKTLFVFLSIKNPLVIPDLYVHSYQNYASILTGQSEEFGSDYKIFEPNEIPELTYTKKFDEEKNLKILQRALLQKGIDGFKYENTEEDRGNISWIILKPGQAMPIFKLLKMVD